MRLSPSLTVAVAVACSAAFVLSAGVGCSAKPKMTERVDASVLPLEAKALLSNDAQITSVERETYAKGTVMYRIGYTEDGQNKVVRYNSKMQSTPTGVFEDPMR